jgi:hypothetical protein
MAPINSISNQKDTPNRDQILTLGDLETFRTDVLSEIKSMFRQAGETYKRWLKSAEVKTARLKSSVIVKNWKAATLEWIWRLLQNRPYQHGKLKSSMLSGTINHEHQS